MTVTLDLPREIEAELSAEAARLGFSLEEYLLRLLSGYVFRSLSAAPMNERKPMTGAELVAYWEREGLIGTRPDIEDSQSHAREIRRKAEHRDRE